LKNKSVIQHAVIEINTPNKHPATDIIVSFKFWLSLVFKTNTILGPGIADSAEIVDRNKSQVYKVIVVH
ncbi:hypothetical protein, partial [Acinetobacter oleivorans]|uniref:hypothetical protein n=1 Tax=Acinetobacter oleivorans TaxID=1148157 RepID=UPI001C0A0587